jgi:hypothetical protein
MNSLSFAEIISQSVIQENKYVFRSLGSPDDLQLEYYERLFDSFENGYSIPNYQVAVDWYCKAYPHESDSEYLPTTVKHAYSWMLEGFKREIRLERSEQVIKNLLALFTDWQDVAEVYSLNKQALDSLPYKVKNHCLTEVELLTEAVHGASRVIVEGIEIIKSCLPSALQSTHRNLTEREKALMHCYKEGPPIKKNQPLYDDYITFCTTRKRVSYPNESKSKARSLIKSIEKVLPHLSEAERKQAQNEIDTIRANFSN